MRRTTFAIGACACLIVLVAITKAQTPSATPYQGPAPTQTYPVAGTSLAAYPAPPPGTYYSPFFDDSGAEGLLVKWKTANETDRKGIEKDLRVALKRSFQTRLDADETEVKQLEAQVKQLHEKLDLRRRKQEEIVEFRAQQLLRETQGLGWGVPQGALVPVYNDSGVLAGYAPADAPHAVVTPTSQYSTAAPPGTAAPAPKNSKEPDPAKPAAK